jgi:triosephosphate isomerase
MRIPVIAGNWKMYKTDKEAYELASSLKDRLKGVDSIKVVLCPPFTALSSVAKGIEGSNIVLGAQNMHWEDEGAFTGEISPGMLLSIGCSFVILGHSERRMYFGETNEIINKKLKKALEAGLNPIVCVGERLEERESGKTEKVVEDHIRGAFKELNPEQAKKAVIAYEPVWAIGTGKTASPKQANDVHRFIREKLKDLYSQEVSESKIILYGGSVKPENAKELLNQADIDGALVGGASLKPDSFEKIVRSGLVLGIHILVCIALMISILLQSSKGEGLAGAFGGSGITGAVFGGRGAATFLSKATAVLGTAFFVISLGLTFMTPGQRATQTEGTVQEEAQRDMERGSPPATAIPTPTQTGEQGETQLPTVPDQEQQTDKAKLPPVPEEGQDKE